MKNLKSKNIEAIKMPSIEKQKELLENILNYISKDIDYVGVSQEDYDSISNFAHIAFKNICEKDFHTFTIIQKVVENKFEAVNSDSALYYLLLTPVDYILRNQLGYKFLSEESRWVKINDKKSINLTELFSDVIDINMEKHFKHLCSQIEKDYTAYKDIISPEKLKVIYLFKPHSIGNIKENFVIVQASNREEAIKKATLQVADHIEEWMFDMFDLDKVKNKFFKSFLTINEDYYVFEKLDHTNTLKPAKKRRKFY